MYNKYREFIQNYVDISDEEWGLYISKFQVESYKKDQIIHYAGEICRKISFINSGLARAYVISNEGKDYTWNIMFNDAQAQVNNLFVVDYYSFVTQKESIMSIVAMEDCELLSINHNDVEEFHKILRNEETFSRHISEISYATLYERIINRQIKTAKERFEYFMKKTPYLLDKVPQYHIATYLGITPQYLSQLKNSYKY